MKGLFLNGFYSAIGSIKLFLLVLLAACAVLLATGSPTAQELFVYLAVTAFPVNAVVSARRDAASKWNRYELTLPIRRRDVVACKYGSYLLWTVAGIVVAAAGTAAAALLHGGASIPHGAASLCSMFTLGAGIALLSGALFYPIAYVAGMEKSETVLIISVLGAIGLVIAATNVLGGLLGSFTARMAVLVVFYLLMFVASYRISRWIYRKKEL